MHCFIPDLATLFHAIQTPLEFPDVVLHARLRKTFGLFHIHALVSREHVIEICSFDVDLVDFPVLGGSEVENEVERLHVQHRRGSVYVILAEDLFVPFRNELSLVADRCPFLVAFDMKDPLTVQDTASRGSRRAGNKLED